ncbi:hypothetical protein GH714_031793 [Hevea brasiliensis]|uniref:Uncharacterized protein n=1 Tax=Hevea brasiliensis TaxID=3981 RepID=A0A6A6LFX8_HEVBR|nr:hypothetical protein GH714_031793 [Hevea brasiliensis]
MFLILKFLCMQATKVVKPEADQAFRSHDHINAKDEASGSHVQPMEETKKLSIVTHGHINVEDEASGSHVQPMEETKKLSIVTHGHINVEEEARGSHVQPMEETKKLSIVTHGHINVEDEASGSHVQPMEETKKLSIVTTLIEPSDIVIDTKYLKGKLDFLKKEAAGKPVKTRIQRVPPMLSENQELKKYYKPTVVAIGPIHHRARDANFEYGESMKHILADQFMIENEIEAQNLYKSI